MEYTLSLAARIREVEGVEEGRRDWWRKREAFLDLPASSRVLRLPSLYCAGDEIPGFLLVRPASYQLSNISKPLLCAFKKPYMYLIIKQLALKLSTSFCCQSCHLSWVYFP